MAELLARISSQELAEWMAFDSLEPIGDRRADLQAGVVCATMANLERPAGHRAYQPHEFMPGWDEPSPTEIRKRRIAQVKALAVALGARRADTVTTSPSGLPSRSKAGEADSGRYNAPQGQDETED